MNKIAVVIGCIVLGSIVARSGRDGNAGATGDAGPAGLEPVASTKSGILLEPPVDLSWFTRQEFEAYSSALGRDKVWRPWTSAITHLPPVRPAGEARPLTEPEVKRIMLQVRDLFESGKAATVSDVGLISTHEDVNRKPMYNHVAAFDGPSIGAYLLVQSLAGTKRWGYFSIVQDLETEPPTVYFGDISRREVILRGNGCYKCHSSGALALHPARADLVSDATLLKAINRHIVEQPASRLYLPENERPDDYGMPLKLKACTRCHGEDADRGPLFRAHSHPIRMLVDFGYMPPDRRLKPEELADLKSWLGVKP